MKKLSIALWCLYGILGAMPADASTISAVSPSATDVQNAINLAVSGDTVTVPAGISTWTATVQIPQGKNITLQGAGIDATNIYVPGNNDNVVQVVNGSSRVTGFTFYGGTVIVDGDGWRIDHCRMVSLVPYVLNGQSPHFLAFNANGLRQDQAGPSGLVDHITTVDGGGVITGYPDFGYKNGHTWADPLPFGTARAVYIEDSTFTFHGEPNVMDCDYGGSFVFRHNAVYNSSTDTHSVQGWNRACRSWEIYSNLYTLQPGYGYFTVMFIRGGTGAIYNNTALGPWTYPVITFDNVRSFGDRMDPIDTWYVNPTVNTLTGSAPTAANAGFGVDYSHPGRCGSDTAQGGPDYHGPFIDPANWVNPHGVSNWDGNQHVAPAHDAGWPCRDQIGRGQDVSMWTDPTQTPPAQTSVPAYVWNNTINGVPLDVGIGNNSNAWLVNGRDYIQDSGPMPGYSAFSYPHPLQSGAVIVTTVPAPAKPIGLSLR